MAQTKLNRRAIKRCEFKRVIGHIDTVAKIGHAGTIYRSSTPYTPYYYSRSDLRFAYKPAFWISVNDRVEFSIQQIGDKHYAQNITYPGGKPLRPLLITSRRSLNYWSLSIHNNAQSQQTRALRHEYDTRIRVSSVLHPTKRTVGIVISEMRNNFGWILCNVVNSLPIRYHITQIQSIGIKKLVLHSRVECNVIKGRDHDWSFYITKPGGNLITYEKADIYGQWLRSLELYGRKIKHRDNILYIRGYICEYSLARQIGWIAPFDALHKRYMFHIDNCNTAACENRRVFLNDEVEFELELNPKNGTFYAMNVRSVHSDGVIHGKHWNWSKLLPYNRKYSYSSHYLHKCVDKLSEEERYCGLVEFNAYELANMYKARIYFDSIELYPRTLRVPLSELQCTDVEYVRRGTKVEFSLNIDREKRMITGVQNITAPNGRLLTFLSGERGEFYRWRNINCNVKLKSVYDELGSNETLSGFIRDLDVKGKCGVIEVISNDACYGPVFFWFADVLFEKNNKYVTIASVVEFNVTINTYCYLYSGATNQANIKGYKWTSDPRFYLTVKAINIVSHKYDKYIHQPPMFKMSHVQCINNKLIT